MGYQRNKRIYQKSQGYGFVCGVVVARELTYQIPRAFRKVMDFAVESLFLVLAILGSGEG